MSQVGWDLVGGQTHIFSNSLSVSFREMSIGYKKRSNGIATGMDTKNKQRDVVLLFYMGIRNWISPD